MKKVLCFGDSNTFGFNPKNGSRYPENIRWTGVLKSLCKDSFEIIEKGCNNRTCFSENSDGILQTGYKILPSLLECKPEIVVLAIGINDLQRFYNPDFEQIKEGIINLVKIVRSNCQNAQIIIAAPSRLTYNVLKSGFSFQFNETSIKKSQKVPEIYQEVSKTTGCKFIDFNKIAKVSETDGLHYEPDEHKKIAKEMFELLNSL